MKLDIIDCNIIMTVRGEFEGQPFEAAYTSDDGWNAGSGIKCLNENFIDSDEYDDWHEELEERLWDHDIEVGFKKVEGPIDTPK